MSTRRRLLLGAAGVLLLTLVLFAVLTGQDGRAQPETTENVARPDTASVFTVEYVFDGDTIEATPVDAGARRVAGTTESVRMRLIGIDTPEGTPTPECGAEAARDRLRDLLPEGSRVWIDVDAEPRDRYDRLLVYLWSREDEFVNATLVREGHAVALRIEPNVAHAELFAAAEDAARREGTGGWSACG